MRPRWRVFRQDAGRVAGPPAIAYGFLFILSLAIGQWSIARYGTVLVWPANGVLLAALLQLHRKAAIRLLAVCFVFNLVGNYLRADPPRMLLLNAVLNFGEVILAGLIARRFCGAALDMRRPARLARFAFLAVAPAAMTSAVIGLTILHPPLAQVPVDLETWFTVETLGLLIVTPTLLLLARNHRFAEVRSTRQALEPALLIGALVAVTTAVFAQSAAPVVFLIFPPLLLIAFRLSPSWSACGVMLIALIGTVFTLNGHGPMTLSTLGPRSWPRADLLPLLRALPVFHLFMAAVLCVALPASTALTERRRFEARLRAKTDAAVQARLMAEQAAVAKSCFLSMMSHEMRTPLNGVSGFAEILAAGQGLEPDTARQIDHIRKSSQRLSILVDEILDFSRGEIEIVRAPLCLAAIVEDAAGDLRQDAERKGLTVSVSGDADLEARHLGDERRIRQVLGHLMSNAVKFTDRGGVDLALGLSPGGEAVEIAIADTGPGIPADMLARLFEPFAQGDATTTRSHEGAGMGLALSRRLAGLMGGTILGANRPEGGAVFRLTLPLEPAPAARRPEPAEVAQSGDPRAPRILVVDDHQTNREVAKVMLEAFGCDVEIARDGLESLASVRSADFDLVLMDVRMPNMDGLEATRRIRGLAAPAAAMPIVAMTADAMPEDVARCLCAGMNAHLAKPIAMASLRGVLERFLTGAAEEPATDLRNAG